MVAQGIIFICVQTKAIGGLQPSFHLQIEDFKPSLLSFSNLARLLGDLNFECARDFSHKTTTSHFNGSPPATQSPMGPVEPTTFAAKKFLAHWNFLTFSSVY